MHPDALAVRNANVRARIIAALESMTDRVDLADILAEVKRPPRADRDVHALLQLEAMAAGIEAIVAHLDAQGLL